MFFLKKELLLFKNAVNASVGVDEILVPLLGNSCKIEEVGGGGAKFLAGVAVQAV